MRYMLIDGKGNFGSVDGDPPAAYRYTEARLERISDEMLRDIEKDTVDWDPNFDESRKEPRVLPSRFPNLLVNGSSGIAVGMATNIPPHNLREVINAAVCLLDDPEATISDLMEHISGPDFPTKGIIMGRNGIRQAYATGRGRIVVRARAEFEEFGKDKRTRIIVNELPYQVNKSMLVKNIKDQVNDKRLDGISDLRDESDRNGMRIVIELKRDANPQVVLNRLFAQTQMQSAFSVIMLALVNNQTQPKVLNLREMLTEYLTFQEEVIVRRTRYDRRKALERAHLLEGLIIAQDNIDEVIHIIRTAYDDAKERLMERFGLDDIQAQAILDMRLKALQGLDREKLQSEYDELEKKIAYYDGLLASPELIRGVLKDELIAIRDKYGDDRKTEIQDVEEEIDFEDLINEEECVFTLTHGGYIKRIAVSEYRSQGRGGKGIKAMSTKDDDYVETVFTASTHDYLLFFTSLGKVYRKKGYNVPAANRTARGTNIVNLIQVEQGEKVTAILHFREMEEDGVTLV
ncbi:MAG: DNA gyrase subunit A, partial [Oscillospiraceae bacterium]|nr:DNA gyrase subunit A [Oscillospiraceae bacterium]